MSIPTLIFPTYKTLLVILFCSFNNDSGWQYLGTLLGIGIITSIVAFVLLVIGPPLGAVLAGSGKRKRGAAWGLLPSAVLFSAILIEALVFMPFLGLYAATGIAIALPLICALVAGKERRKRGALIGSLPSAMAIVLALIPMAIPQEEINSLLKSITNTATSVYEWRHP